MTSSGAIGLLMEGEGVAVAVAVAVGPTGIWLGARLLRCMWKVEVGITFEYFYLRFDGLLVIFVSSLNMTIRWLNYNIGTYQYVMLLLF